MRLKRFTVWDTGSDKFKGLRTRPSTFEALRTRLLLCYLGVMVPILALSAIAIDCFFASSLERHLDKRLLNLADAAAHSLVSIKRDRRAATRSYPMFVDEDLDLDIPWQKLRQGQQGVEWFDAEGRLLVQTGARSLEKIPLQVGIHSFPRRHARAIAIAAYSYSRGQQHLEGYVRASESTKGVEAMLVQLRWGMLAGGALALVSSGIGAWWLAKQSLAPVERSFEQLKQFTADASHELRSPLTAIKTAIEVMQMHPERIHPADVKKIAAIASATHQMAGLVEDLLLLTRLEASPTQEFGKQALVSLDELLDNLVDCLELQARAKAVTMEWDGSEDLPVLGDGHQLVRLFSNLLQNAIQYTPAGGTVSVKAFGRDRAIVTRIEDTGIGIAPEELPLVFRRFWRSDRARTRRQGGLGMGLAIAASIARTHGGTITASSQLGVGSCFEVSLPRSREPAVPTSVEIAVSNC